MSDQVQLDFVTSSQRVQVLVDGVKVADTSSPLLVLEGALPTRYYIPIADVDRQYLAPVDTQTHCPYKGNARYYNVVVRGEIYDNAAWYYPDPIAAAPLLKGAIAFWPEKDPRIQVLVDEKITN
ncbi:MAG: DUF427 domain-containing protein [Caldilineaceae bacterium]